MRRKLDSKQESTTYRTDWSSNQSAMKMEGVCMLLVLLLGTITAKAQLSFSNSSLSATVLEGGEQVCPAEEQLETARATINQNIRRFLGEPLFPPHIVDWLLIAQ